jgi:hypothetical protein
VVDVIVITGPVMSVEGGEELPSPPPPLQPAMTREKEVKTSREAMDRFITLPPRRLSWNSTINNSPGKRIFRKNIELRVNFLHGLSGQLD